MHFRAKALIEFEITGGPTMEQIEWFIKKARKELMFPIRLRRIEWDL